MTLRGLQQIWYILRGKNFYNQQHQNEVIAVENRHFHKSGNWKARKLNEAEKVTTKQNIKRKEFRLGKKKNQTKHKLVKHKLAQKHQLPTCQKANLRPKDVSKTKVISETRDCKTSSLFSFRIGKTGSSY